MSPVPLQISHTTTLSLVRVPLPSQTAQVIPSSLPSPLQAAHGISSVNVSKPLPSQTGHVGMASTVAGRRIKEPQCGRGGARNAGLG
jgi:hypothetical protein